MNLTRASKGIVKFGMGAVNFTVAGLQRNHNSVSPDRQTPRTYYILSAAHGSFGDEAFALGAIGLARKGATPFSVIAPGNAAPWHRAGAVEVESSAEYLTPGLLRLTPFARREFSVSDVTVLGADTIDGKYEHHFLASRIHALNTSAQNGGSAKLVNFSLSESPTRFSRRILRSLDERDEVWARDSDSQRRMHILLEREVRVAPDVAMFLEPVHTDRVTAFKSGLQENVPRVVLVPNSFFTWEYGLSFDEITRFWVSLARRFSDGAEVVIMPHDIRGKVEDVKLVRRIAADINGGESRVSVFEPDTSAEAKALMDGASVAVSSRMHACIASLSVGVPTIGLEYFGKFQGQFAWYEDMGLTIPFQKHLDPGEVYEASMEFAQSRSVNRGASPRPKTVGWI